MNGNNSPLHLYQSLSPHNIMQFPFALSDFSIYFGIPRPSQCPAHSRCSVMVCCLSQDAIFQAWLCLRITQGTFLVREFPRLLPCPLGQWIPGSLSMEAAVGEIQNLCHRWDFEAPGLIWKCLDSGCDIIIFFHLLRNLHRIITWEILWTTWVIVPRRKGISIRGWGWHWCCFSLIPGTGVVKSSWQEVGVHLACTQYLQMLFLCSWQEP